MNNLLKGSFIAALILLLGGCSEQIYAQRCGGDVSYIVRNESGEIIDPEEVGLKFVRVKITNSSTEPVIEYENENSVRDVDSIKTVRFPTGCGVYLAEVALEIEGRLMLLRFHHIPMELNFFIDSLPFQEGTFEIDFKSNTRLEGMELNREGLKCKEGKCVLRDVAQAGYLVSATNWKRTITQQ
jgi:hypothetical protein